MSTKEVHAEVETRLKMPIAIDSVRSCLTEAVRLGRFGVERVAPGVFTIPG
ncbi:MAG: hypothetical protein IPK93_12455 [Solirubrobacterales bacterium]|nr:hypothetical protein [Solirubrobacterales bacterium]